MNRRVLGIIAGALAALVLGTALVESSGRREEAGSAATPADAIAATLNGTWVVKIAGESRARTLTVFGLAPTGFGAAGASVALNGTYGFADGTPSSVRIDATGDADGVAIAFLSPAKAKIAARTTSPAELRGTFEFKGETRDLLITRAPVTATAKRDSKLTFVYVSAFN
jgi:hypothetical protein